MKFDLYTFSIFYLFIPGLVCTLIVFKLTTHRDKGASDYIIPSLVNGFIIFIIYGFLSEIFEDLIELPKYTIIPDGSDSLSSVTPKGVGFALLIGVIYAFLESFFLNHKFLHRFAKLIRVTRKFGDRDVWSYIMNSEDTEWVVVRVPEENIFYLGYIIAHSDEEDVRELVLGSTQVFDNESGDKRYDAGTIYFSFPNENVKLELYKGDNDEEGD